MKFIRQQLRDRCRINFFLILSVLTGRIFTGSVESPGTGKSPAGAGCKWHFTHFEFEFRLSLTSIAKPPAAATPAASPANPPETPPPRSNTDSNSHRPNSRLNDPIILYVMDEFSLSLHDQETKRISLNGTSQNAEGEDMNAAVGATTRKAQMAGRSARLIRRKRRRIGAGG